MYANFKNHLESRGVLEWNIDCDKTIYLYFKCVNSLPKGREKKISKFGSKWEFFE